MLVLSAGVGSVVPAGGATVAVLPTGPMALVVPVTVTVIKSPVVGAVAEAFTGSKPLAKLTALPEPLVVPQVAVPVAAQVQVTPVKLAGTESAMVAAVVLLGPWFQTTSL